MSLIFAENFASMQICIKWSGDLFFGGEFFYKHSMVSFSVSETFLSGRWCHLCEGEGACEKAGHTFQISDRSV